MNGAKCAHGLAFKCEREKNRDRTICCLQSNFHNVSNVMANAIKKKQHFSSLIPARIVHLSVSYFQIENNIDVVIEMLFLNQLNSSMNSALFILLRLCNLFSIRCYALLC